MSKTQAETSNVSEDPWRKSEDPWKKHIYDVCKKELRLTPQQRAEYEALQLNETEGTIQAIAHKKFVVATFGKSLEDGYTIDKVTICKMLSGRTHAMSPHEYVLSVLHLKVSENPNIPMKCYGDTDYDIPQGDTAQMVIYHTLDKEIIQVTCPDNYWKHTLGELMYPISENPGQTYEQTLQKYDKTKNITERTKGKVFTLLDGEFVFIYVFEKSYVDMPNHHFVAMPFLPLEFPKKDRLKIFCTDLNGIGVPIPYEIGELELLLAKRFSGQTIEEGENLLFLLDVKGPKQIFVQQDEPLLPMIKGYVEQSLSQPKRVQMGNEFRAMFKICASNALKFKTRTADEEYYENHIENLEKQKDKYETLITEKDATIASLNEKYKIIIAEKDATIASLDETAYVAKWKAYVAEADAKVAQVQEKCRLESVSRDNSVQNEVKTLRDRIESLERQLSQARANTPDSGKKAKWNDTRKSRGDDDDDDAGGSSKKKRKGK
jgi:hypothetical protein